MLLKVVGLITAVITTQDSGIKEIMLNTRFTEAAIKRDIVRATNKLIKEYKLSFKSDLTLSIEYPTPLSAEIRIDFNVFKSDNDVEDIKLLESELSRLSTGALNVSTDYYCGGLLAPSLIKRGKKIDCDCLMSYVTATFTYASNFK